MKRTLLLTNFLILVVLSLIALVNLSSADDGGKLRIAAILPLTGEIASWGQAFKNGMQMGLESLPEATRAKLDIVYEDDALSPKNTISIFNKLRATASLDGVITLSSGCSKALAPITESKKVLLLGVGSDGAISRGRSYAFNFWVTPEEEVRVMIPELRRRKISRIARVGTVQDGVVAVNEAFDRATKGMVEVSLNEDFSPENKDFRTYIAKIRSRQDQLDGVMVVLLPGQLNIFARQARELGVTLPFIGFETVEDTNEVKLSGGTLVGTWYVNADDGDGKFLDAYRKRFPGASSFLAANGYDAVRLFADALGHGFSAENLHEHFRSVKNFSGALGTYSATGDQRFSLPATLKVVTKDGFSKLP